MALVRKILESVLTAGQTSISFNDSDIPNSLIRVYASKADLFPVRQTLSGNVITIEYEAQSNNVGIALEIVKQGLDIVDDLTTEDNTKALSANQGYVLKGLIDGIVIPTVPENITDLDDVEVTDIANGQVLAWNSVAEKFENVTPVSTPKVFIDVNNVITTLTGNASFQSYIATEDCYCIGTPNGGTERVAIQIDGVTVAYSPTTGAQIGVCVLVKAGQTINYRIGSGQTVTIYGTK